MKNDYSNPLVTRYASYEMRHVFSDEFRFRKWRECWCALAQAEMELGLPVKEEQLQSLRSRMNDINYEVMAEFERKLRHDVMAGVHAYGEQCPDAMPIIHLGATSCDVTDNSELMQIFEGLNILKKRMISVIRGLADFAEKYKSLQCLGYTHFQSAQPVSLGKRAAVWLYELMLVFEELEHETDTFKLRGLKGATGTQDSFLKLFDNDKEKVKKLNRRYCEILGFDRDFSLTGQTYPRVYDSKILGIIGRICECAAKFASDFRLMQHMKMIEEPFEKNQIGSSAMAYKKNPMRCERICSLARFAIAQTSAASSTSVTQWLERTLDDSAGRRLYVPMSFMACDAVLSIYANVIKGARVYPAVIGKIMNEELPFMITEKVIMESVKKGHDRQVLHEAVRCCAVEAAEAMKEGKENPMMQLMADNAEIPFNADELNGFLHGLFSGRSEDMTIDFLNESVKPLLEKYRNIQDSQESVRV